MEESGSPPHFKDGPEPVGFRDGNLFIIDLIPEMFTVDPDTKETHFLQCLQAYGRILSQKLSWNRKDWMGLIFFSTNVWDMEPENKHILTVQEFAEITPKMLYEVIEIIHRKVDYYKNISTQSEYPLHDVLWHAAGFFESTKVAMSQCQVILVTCRDNPFSEDEVERHRVRMRAKAFTNINVNLRILGLGKDWDHSLFYRDIEMLANNIESEDIKRMFLDDLEAEIKSEARTTSHLQFRIGNGLHISTVISPFSGAPKYLKEVRMCKETNEIIEVFQRFRKTQSYDDESGEESEEPVTSQARDGTRRAIRCGDKLISFEKKEIREIRNPGPVGIDLIGFKKRSLDLRYHISPTKFIGVETSASDEEKKLFTALLYQCDNKEVMAICVVYDRGGPYLAKMLPCTNYGGFYLYKIAFVEQVNDLHGYLKPHIHGAEEESDVPIDEPGVKLMKKVVKKLRIIWDPTMFHNPKVHAQLAYIETLALDTVVDELKDTTLPATERMVQRLGSITTKFEEMFGSLREECAKRSHSSARPETNLEKHAKLDDNIIKELVESEGLRDCTVPTLRTMARSLGARTSGSKAEVIERIVKSWAAKNAG